LRNTDELVEKQQKRTECNPCPEKTKPNRENLKSQQLQLEKKAGVKIETKNLGKVMAKPISCT